MPLTANKLSKQHRHPRRMESDMHDVSRCGCWSCSHTQAQTTTAAAAAAAAPPTTTPATTVPLHLIAQTEELVKGLEYSDIRQRCHALAHRIAELTSENNSSCDGCHHMPLPSSSPASPTSPAWQRTCQATAPRQQPQHADDLAELQRQHTLLKAMLAAKAVADARQGKGCPLPSLFEMRCQELQVLEAERTALQDKLVAFERRMLTHRDRLLLTVDQHELWERKYARYHELQRRCAELRSQLHAIHDSDSGDHDASPWA
ncbi:hypothetical protein PTSG_07189 [Salpingoeca rosetta]|uniref:Uncharacterized protein n=1 Tax=Salpingoeca rosetta (strain ATCC 50818 / BSB-021) TaxID=946362 RepID=F2UEB4_SALR5|nr:uncharacterized protein PTSG_07189 [Salpingoeca rosetta]EGD74964.1 hypothetical protein PTSG_07189 [Salpingoeca rosetta]|eukprot:XP_004992609.1 hypothetical protein PTSG_07189 [Salpingoeca rosetta]